MWYGIVAKGTVERGLKVYMYDCGWGKNALRHAQAPKSPTRSHQRARRARTARSYREIPEISICDVPRGIKSSLVSSGLGYAVLLSWVKPHAVDIHAGRPWVFISRYCIHLDVTVMSHSLLRNRSKCETNVCVSDSLLWSMIPSSYA